MSTFKTINFVGTILKKTLILNLKNNENDAEFDEILNKKRKLKENFKKMKGIFWTANVA